MNSDQDEAIRAQLLDAMRGDQAHLDFDSSISDISVELSRIKPDGAPHTIWQLLEHMRITQHDILEFSRNPKHKSPKWPEGYWTKTEAPANQHAWDKTVAEFRKELKEMEELIGNLEHDLFKPIEGGTGQTLLREALLVAAHNSYHLGQLVFLKKMLLAKGS